MQQILASGEWVPQLEAYTTKVESMHTRLTALSKKLGVIRTRCATLGEVAAAHNADDATQRGAVRED
jgi:hypothetical protein